MIKKFIDLEIKTDELDGMRPSKILQKPKSQVVENNQSNASENVKQSLHNLHLRISPNLENTNDARKMNSMILLQIDLDTDKFTSN